MMASPRKLIAGNWKMNGTRAAFDELDRMIAGAGGVSCDVAVFPPATLLREAVTRTAASAMLVGAQTCHDAASGAHTGDIAAEMIADTGATMVIVGHSERRADHKESDADVRAKADAARRAGLKAVLCIGETGAEREAGATEAVLARQLAGSVPDEATPDNLVVAYEPVWAIGTGLTASQGDIVAAHAHIRSRLVDRFGDQARGFRILYGGSVKPGNAAAILGLDGVDGALVGGASLKAEDFLAIAAAAS
ncbi:MAG: triose-phosphate isomerase [Alphaproteobacteria bacterium]